MYASKICSYAQGFALLRIASVESRYNLNLSNIASIWRGGCIIRAKFLDRIRDAFESQPDLRNLLLDESFVGEIKERVEAWRDVASTAVKAGISLPAMTASLAYFEAMRRELLPTNLIQAQRDFFGAHKYSRNDMEGTFHTKWQ